jgi:UDP:flavonoid glycosyltransferase YjiC (YdhE family)
VRAFEFVPGDEAARHAAVVICNGGSTTSYQALAEGTPVVGLPSNFDQYLAMQAIEQAGAGRLVKARNATAEGISSAIEEVLMRPAFRNAAKRWRDSFGRHDGPSNFVGFVEELRATDFMGCRRAH